MVQQGRFGQNLRDTHAEKLTAGAFTDIKTVNGIFPFCIDKDPAFRIFCIPGTGGVTERFKEPVLKTGAGQPAVGSNPTPSVNRGTLSPFPIWRGARAAESGSLLRSCAGDCTEGSNPSLSVRIFSSSRTA